MSARTTKKKNASPKRQARLTENTMRPSKKKTSKSNVNLPETKIMKKNSTKKTAPVTGETEAATTTNPPATAPLSPSIGAAPAATSTATPVGSGASLATTVSNLSTLLDAAETNLGVDSTPAVSTAEKRRKAKPRKGSEKVFGMIAPIVEQHGLNSSSLNTTNMLAANEKAQTLVPLQTRLQKLSKRVDDEVFNAQTDAWSMGLQFYSLIQRRAKNDGALAQSLAPVTKVFSYRHPTVKEEKPTKVQTRVKARLKKTLQIAGKHGIDVAAPGAGTTSVTPAAPPVAQASGVGPAVAVAPAPVAAAVAAAANSAAPAPASTLVVAQALPQAPVPAVSVTAAPVGPVSAAPAVTPGH